MNEVTFGIVNLLRVAQSFPAAPRIMAQLAPLMRDPNSPLAAVAGILRQDRALAARLLRMANSAAYAQSEPVASIADAAALIGLREVHRLVGAVAIDPFSRREFSPYGFAGPRLRDNALLVALLMEELAGFAGADPAEAYAAGLFRSIGQVALAKIADQHPVAPFRAAGSDSLAGWEKRVFGTTGSHAAAAILRAWNFPAGLARAIETHYEAAGAAPLASLLNLAAGLADQLGYGLPGEAPYWLDAATAAAAGGVGVHHCGSATQHAVAAFDRINRVLGAAPHELQASGAGSRV